MKRGLASAIAYHRPALRQLSFITQKSLPPESLVSYFDRLNQSDIKVTKTRFFHNFTYESLQFSLMALRQLLQRNIIRTLSIPRLRSGHDYLHWPPVFSILISYLFEVPYYNHNISTFTLTDSLSSITACFYNPWAFFIVFATREKYHCNSNFFKVKKSGCPGIAVTGSLLLYATFRCNTFNSNFFMVKKLGCPGFAVTGSLLLYSTFRCFALAFAKEEKIFWTLNGATFEMALILFKFEKWSSKNKSFHTPCSFAWIGTFKHIYWVNIALPIQILMM